MKESENNLQQEIQEENLDNLFTFNGPMSQKRYEAIRKDFHMAKPLPEDQKTSALHKRLNPTGQSKSFENVGIKSDRVKTQANMFRLYLMAVKGLDFDAAWNMLEGHQDYEKNITDFLEFVEKHPIKGEGLDEKKAVQNAVEWAKIYTGAAEKMKNYKVPDIDYSDPQQLEKENEKLQRIMSSAMDFGQEYEALMDTGHADAIKEALGEEYLQEQTAVFYKAQPFFTLYNLGYNIPGFKPGIPQVKVPDYVNDMAVNRVLLQEQGEKLRGKTFGEAFSLDMDPESIAYSTKSAKMRNEVLIHKETYGMATGITYLRGQNKLFQDGLIGHDEEFKEQARLDFNQTQYDNVRVFGNTVDSEKAKYGKHFQDIFSGGKSGEEIAQILSNPKAEEKKDAVLSSVNTCFKRFAADHQISYYRLLGKKPYEVFRVDGKTAEKRWGEKYASVQDPKLKETLYKAEILNAAMHGKCDVTIDMYTMNKKLSPRENIPGRVTGSRHMLAKEKAFYDEVTELRKKLMEMKGRLAQTQEDPEANFGKNAGFEGSKYYQDMTVALQTCIEKTDLTKSANNMNDLKAALTRFKKASAKYVSERDNLTHAWLRDGRRRLAEAKGGVKLATDSLELFDQMSKDLVVAGPHNCGNPREFSFKNQIEQFEKNCKRSGLDGGSKDLSADEITGQRDNAMTAVRRRRALKKKITEMSQDAVTTGEKLDYSIGTETMMQKARNYYKAFYFDQINKASEVELNQMNHDFNSREFNLKFHQDAEKLSESPLFRKCVRERPESYIQTYHANWMKADKKQLKKGLDKAIDQGAKITGIEIEKATGTQKNVNGNVKAQKKTVKNF